jgi:hypothetical protein
LALTDESAMSAQWSVLGAFVLDALEIRSPFGTYRLVTGVEEIPGPSLVAFRRTAPDDRVWDATAFTKNRERLQRGEVLQKFTAKLLDHPKVKPLLSDEHFSVDGTLIEAWASHKSFKPKDGDKDDDGSDFHAQTRRNDTHASTSDPDAKLYRKAAGREARLSYMGHALMENRNGLVVGGLATLATGTAEREAALALVDQARSSSRRITLAADKAYDVAAFVAALRVRSLSQHSAIDGHVRVTGRPRRTSVDGRATRHSGYAISQRCRKRIEEVFGWIKGSAGLAKVKLRGVSVSKPTPRCGRPEPTPSTLSRELMPITFCS